MRILIATDKFKDALSAEKVCQYLKEGISQSFPKAKCTTLPLADGGEGTLEVLAKNLGGKFITAKVYDPLFRTVAAKYLWIESQKMAVVEMASASGLELLQPAERNCGETTTFGTGQLIEAAIKKGAANIVLTVGGSATNDAGVGMASALGFSFFDKEKKELKPVGKNLFYMHYISKTTLPLNKIKFQVVTDVTNPLHGKNGAAFVYAGQKGANESEIKQLDAGLKNMARLMKKYFSKEVSQLSGAGAGGGMGAGASVFLNAKIKSAAQWILEVCEVEKILSHTDILITGEGKLDSQTWSGKLIDELNKSAFKHGVPSILVCGTLADAEIIRKQENILYAASILNAPMTLIDALGNSKPLLREQGELLGRLLKRIKW